MFRYEQRLDKIQYFTIEKDGEEYKVHGNLLHWRFVEYLLKNRAQNVSKKKELILHGLRNVAQEDLLDKIAELTDKYFFNDMLSRLGLFDDVSFEFGRLQRGVAGALRVTEYDAKVIVNLVQMNKWQTNFEQSNARSYGFEGCRSTLCTIASNVRHELVHWILVACSPRINGKLFVEIDKDPAHNRFFKRILFNQFNDNSIYHTFDEFNYKST
jgi:hypothetical protein